MQNIPQFGKWPQSSVDQLKQKTASLIATMTRLKNWRNSNYLPVKSGQTVCSIMKTKYARTIEVFALLTCRNIRRHFDCTFLFSNTESFVMKFARGIFFSVVPKKKSVLEHFDFSHFPAEHPLHILTNARVTPKIKDEMAGRSISKFCGLKPKLHGPYRR